MRLLAIVVALALLTGCPGKARKPDLPGSTVVKPTAVLVEREVYVAIPANLTQERPIAEGPLERCWFVAADRKAELTKANAQLREIAEIAGTVLRDDKP